MSRMRVKKIFENSDNKKVMEINILPSKYCNFNCVFCPLGPNGTQTGESFSLIQRRPFCLPLPHRLMNSNRMFFC